jgi:hypothetical protein
MEYFKNILWLLSWPAMIYISYLAGLYALKKFEINLKNDHGASEKDKHAKT